MPISRRSVIGRLVCSVSCVAHPQLVGTVWHVFPCARIYGVIVSWSVRIGALRRFASNPHRGLADVLSASVPSRAQPVHPLRCLRARPPQPAPCARPAAGTPTTRRTRRRPATQGNDGLRGLSSHKKIGADVGTGRHQAECSWRQSVGTSSEAMTAARRSRDDEVDPWSQIGVPWRSTGGADRADPVFHPNSDEVHTNLSPANSERFTPRRAVGPVQRGGGRRP